MFDQHVYKLTNPGLLIVSSIWYIQKNKVRNIYILQLILSYQICN